MAAYATKAEMYGLALNQGAFTGIADVDLDSALEGASRFADSYLTRRFQLPLSLWGQDLKEAVSNIASYRALSVRGFSPEQGDAEQLRQKYEDAVKWLKDIGSGHATPFGVSDASGGGTQAVDELSSPPVVVQYRAETSSGETLFSRSSTTPGGVGPPKPRGW